MKVILPRILLRAGFLGIVWTALAPPGVAASPPVRDADRPLQIIRRARMDFPNKLIRAGITNGAVQLYLDVDAEGKLVDHLIVAYTHYEFSNIVAKTVARWRFAPAIVKGRPVSSTVALDLRFEVNGLMVTERTAAEEPPTVLGEYMYRARTLHELDRLPRPLVTTSPTNPAPPGEPVITGRARVDFFIDEEGRVRMPVVAAADDERLGWSALAAIAHWEFEVPMRAGFPVLVRASQVFTFAPEN